METRNREMGIRLDDLSGQVGSVVFVLLLVLMS